MKDTNYVRVKDLNNPLSEEETQEINATVKIENMESGASDVLTDTVVSFENVYTHNYKSTIEVFPNTDYRITVEGERGSPVRARGTTPKIATTDVSPTEEDCKTPFEITFEPISGSVKVSIGVFYQGRLESFSRRAEPQDDDERVLLSMTPEIAIKRALGRNLAGDQLEDPVRCHDLSGDIVRVQYVVYGPDFLGTGSSSDENIPAELRRFGGFYRGEFSFRIDTTDVYPDT